MKIKRRKMIGEKEKIKLKEIFANYKKIDAVYLFGSQLTGKLRHESDIDLGIITEDENFKKRKLDILEDLATEGFCNVDLVFLDEADITLKFEIIHNNHIIYKKPGFDQGKIFSDTIRKYLDFYYYLELQRKSYKKRLLNG
jgi:hypothetical protein